MEYCSVSKPGQREINEDCVGVALGVECTGFAVADGLGGHGKGDTASRIAIDEFRKVLEGFSARSLSQSMELIFQNAQQAILKEQERQNAGTQMKTTLAAVIMDERSALCGHIGDTRIYVFHRGKIKKQTLDHSVPQMLVLSREIKEREIRIHPDRNKLLRVLGVQGPVKYDVFSVETRKTQSILLCSDGFWEYILEKEMCDLLKKSHSAQEWLNQMCNIVEHRGTGHDMDNYSAMAVWI